MPSLTHQALVLWAARKMARDGFRIAGYDGESSQGGRWNQLPPPAIVGGVRPDVWGYDTPRMRVAFGEAKTSGDIDTEHTRVQLRTFRRLHAKTSRIPCRLYIAVPRSAARRLDHVLADLGLLGDREIICLHVPDVLIGEEDPA